MTTIETPPQLWPTFFRRAPSDLSQLVAAASAEGLLGLMFADPSVAARVQDAPALRMLLKRRVALQHDAARRVADVAGAERLLFLKGFDYRHRLYASPDLRPMQDLDVYVPPQHLREVLARLEAAGHPRVTSAHGKAWAPGYFEMSIDVGEVRLEIHRSLGHRIRTAVDYDALWNDRRAIDAGGIRVFVASPLHALLIQVLNIAKDELSSPLIRFVDLWLMLRRWPETLPQLAAAAKAWRLENAAYCSLRMLNDLFTTAIELPRRAFFDRLVIPSADARGEISRATRNWRKWWLTDTNTRRLAFAAYSLWLLVSSAAAEALHPNAVREYREAKLGKP